MRGAGSSAYGSRSWLGSQVWGCALLSELERGKITVELGRTLRVLGALGLGIELVPRGSRR